MGSSRETAKPPTPAVILDAGAVIALSRNDERTRRYLERARRAGRRVMVPSIVVAETYRGEGRAVDYVLSVVDDVPASTERTARSAGRLLAAARSSATIDALVVATALEVEPAHVLTSDPDDLRALTPRGLGVEIHAV